MFSFTLMDYENIMTTIISNFASLQNATFNIGIQCERGVFFSKGTEFFQISYN